MVKKKSVKKRAKRVASKGLNSKKKFEMVFRRLVFFLIFFVLFLVLYYAVNSNELWNNFFGLVALIFGFISAALLIVLLVFWFMKLMKK